jgi:ankyrin repeat protein
MDIVTLANEGDLEGVKRLLDNGADVNLRDNYDSTALMWAAYFGYTAIVKLLLDNGADITMQDNYGDTALLMADGQGHTELVELLLDKGGQSI